MSDEQSDRRADRGWLARNGGDTLFEETKEGRRRRVVFGIAMATAALAALGATSAVIAAAANWPIVLVLGAVAIAASAFGGLVALGWWPFLFVDEQLLWRE